MEPIDGLQIRVRWPDRCALCGSSPAPNRRRFQLVWMYIGLNEGDLGCEPIVINPPVCKNCSERVGGVVGALKRVFPDLHQIGDVQDGRLVFNNAQFQRAFDGLNPHLRSAGKNQ